jgi:hypothetical protein
MKGEVEYASKSTTTWMAHWACLTCSNDHISCLSLRVDRFTLGSSFLEYGACGDCCAFWRYAFSPWTYFVSRELVIRGILLRRKA